MQHQALGVKNFASSPHDLHGVTSKPNKRSAETLAKFVRKMGRCRRQHAGGALRPLAAHVVVAVGLLLLLQLLLLLVGDGGHHCHLAAAQQLLLPLDCLLYTSPSPRDRG